MFISVLTKPGLPVVPFILSYETETGLSGEQSGFAEFFGEVFAVVQGDGIKPVEDLDVEDEGSGGQDEQDGNHEPGAVEVVAEEHDSEADTEAGGCDGKGNQGA